MEAKEMVESYLWNRIAMMAARIDSGAVDPKGKQMADFVASIANAKEATPEMSGAVSALALGERDKFLALLKPHAKQAAQAPVETVRKALGARTSTKAIPVEKHMEAILEASQEA